MCFLRRYPVHDRQFQREQPLCESALSPFCFSRGPGQEVPERPAHSLASAPLGWTRMPDWYHISAYSPERCYRGRFQAISNVRMQLTHDSKAGLPNTYNALVYVTFCIGSYLFTLGCFLMTVPVINEASSGLLAFILNMHHCVF